MIHYSKSFPVIQALLLALYSTGRLFTFVKPRGFFDFPVTGNDSFSVPAMLVHIAPVS